MLCKTISRCALLGPLLLTLMADDVQAALVNIESRQLLTSPSEQIGSFEVWLGDDGSLPIEVAGFQLTIRLIGADAGVTFTGVAAPNDATHPYVMLPNSSAPIGAVAADGLSVEIGDFLLSGTALAEEGEGFARIDFQVDPNTIGRYEIELSLEPSETFIADGSFSFYDIQANNGFIGVQVVPEPATGALGILVTCLVAVGGRRKWLKVRS